MSNAPSLVIPGKFIEHIEAHEGELVIRYFSDSMPCAHEGCDGEAEAGWEIDYDYIVDPQAEGGFEEDSACGGGESLYTAFAEVLETLGL